ncbi:MULTISPECIES: hypothetical protein [Staphylococcus]|jgi:hypothetical protein|uniref:Phage protein n=1 Tax=Staphylococcus nepalensis TaxID=214473 RepID=A0ABS3L1J8_9STAP|nr:MULTISPECIES: hypothetical protein [Staphylococcus]PTF47003.1 hypothetical protein BUY18_02100 [Staphylococcus cohnii]ATH60695.1 hypothetical protein BJD96_10490 [Staphylococcus nepalensis]ATH65742.1 hypothetical protein BJG89_10590 [Staphylococcus nepalensis]MBO1213802.1 hypothetical protein [Staphylococcus nepalensis]MBO1214977.1 hypothetical protein [Staphylococcus nepalensis]
MGLRERFGLFDSKGNKMFTVIPNNKDGRHRVSGVIRTFYEGQRWYLDNEELETFIKNYKVERAHQNNIFDYL